MEFFADFSANLLTPPLLFFALGCLAGLLRSNLEIPDSISRYLSLYLMMAIGLKGGVAVSSTTAPGGEVLATAAFGMLIGFLQPVLGYWLLQRTTRLNRATAAAVAAHYGSVSMVTFVTAVAFLDASEIVYAGYIVAVLALMEAPAILSGLLLAGKSVHSRREGNIGREVLTNGAVLLLLGSFAIGWVAGPGGMEKISGFVVDPFQGILCLFLLDMGLLVSRNAVHLKSFSLPLIAFGIYMPLIGALLGALASSLLGLPLGTAMLFIVLCASSSYIAVPAAMRLALPEASASIYLPMSLALTFPFNISIGIPLYHELAKLAGAG